MLINSKAELTMSRRLERKKGGMIWMLGEVATTHRAFGAVVPMKHCTVSARVQQKAVSQVFGQKSAAN